MWSRRFEQYTLLFFILLHFFFSEPTLPQKSFKTWLYLQVYYFFIYSYILTSPCLSLCSQLCLPMSLLTYLTVYSGCYMTTLCQCSLLIFYFIFHICPVIWVFLCPTYVLRMNSLQFPFMPSFSFLFLGGKIQGLIL